ncbi:bifunctional riboflavin kinase/FAD synthetase [Streptococcus didelphis]|uniref:Riboflavin biosynthesis protein n=1 Tax=Streptococcus didelphis TaxID=102886 RepID=A0ABY9LHB5_9STRE|nr:bifunctional riboflavin kinase/FAD synthetase [Streptococcus didelphis]WMB28238.1 bifunctional riboflavin kinase/FAD synthetase [Streptococcus didelphis]WMB28913.1 bifunctional riboflavin kinase/FAD synthetase [Streptococcus didelphis]
MEIKHINSYKEIKEEEPTILVLGYFDGLHKGHKALFDKAKELATKESLNITSLTFNETPQLAFSKFRPDLLLHISYPQKRYEKFAEYGVDSLYLIDFTSNFSMVSSDDFIKNYIGALKAKYIVVGFDYKFGHNRTDSDYLQRNFDGKVYTIEEKNYEGKKISSTWIRNLIKEGEVAKVNKLLGYEFSTRGMVVHGDARGRTLGFPTANLAPIDRTYLPADGVYVADVIVNGKRYRSMTSIGKNVTFGGTELRLEANIFNFESQIYGESIEIIWLDKIRDMTKFEGIEGLIEQLNKDKEKAIHWKAER